MPPDILKKPVNVREKVGTALAGIRGRTWLPIGRRRTTPSRSRPTAPSRPTTSPPGVYRLAIDFHEAGQKPDEPGDRIAWLVQEVTVPETAAKGDKPLELGKFTANVANLFRGDAAPDFEFKTADGRSHRLSDYRGKTVVLRFTEKWDDCPVGYGGSSDDIEKDREAMTEIKRRFLESGHGGPVVWINLSSDPKAASRHRSAAGRQASIRARIHARRRPPR